MASWISFAIWSVLFYFIASRLWEVLYNVFFHPLSRFPGPWGARASAWWKTYVEVVRQESMVDVLFKLHEKYGDIVRVGPNELHFADPDAYNDIYNPTARWDKERTLYEAFGEDHSSFGLLTYMEAKQRKDVLQPMFSRRAILNVQPIVQKNMNHLTTILIKNNTEGKSSDMLFAFRSFAIDNITTFCFGISLSALSAPDFRAPIVEAMDNSLPTFHLFKHLPPIRKLIFSLPPWLAIKASPETAGLTNLQVILGKQVRDIIARPETLRDAEHPTIYHRLLDPDAHKGLPIPGFTALYEEAQTMMFAGGVTVGDTSMTGLFHILSQPDLYTRLREEVESVWRKREDVPSVEVLETLPLLTAAIKEALRMSPGACSPLLRVVPPGGAMISGAEIPGGTVVGMASSFVHRSAKVFVDPDVFRPERWLVKKGEGLEKWLVSFSKGPRSCLGLNLAWCELYVLFATVLRGFELGIDGTTIEDLKWRDCFTPYYPGRHLRVWCKPSAE